MSSSFIIISSFKTIAIRFELNKDLITLSLEVFNLLGSIQRNADYLLNSWSIPSCTIINTISECHVAIIVVLS